MATRPQGVPQDATPIAPGAVQDRTIRSIQQQVTKQNADALKAYGLELHDWAINAQIYGGLDMAVPPMPRPPEKQVLHIVYADAAGNPVAPDTSGAYAWVWQDSEPWDLGQAA